VADDYRQRCADAIFNRITSATIVLHSSVTNLVGKKPGDVTEYDLADAALAVHDDVIDDLVQLVRDLADREPCEDFDHDGHCQTHGWLQDGTCPHARARDILTAQEAGERRG
jgi:hypothetical protein